MKRLSCILTLIVLTVITFTGQSQTPDTKTDFKIPVRIEIGEDKDPHRTRTLIKGYMLAELRKLPNVSIVSKDEIYRFDILAEANEKAEADEVGVAVSICLLERLTPELIQFAIKEEHWEDIKPVLGLLFVPHNNILVVCRRTDLERECREIIVTFDAKLLQPKRELYREKGAR